MGIYIWKKLDPPEHGMQGWNSDTKGMMWQCRGSRSSLHYDPFHNLLCVVAGSKHVRCMSPAATQWLYPHPLYGESANHSAVDFAQPDLARHPLYKEALEHQLSAHLEVSLQYMPASIVLLNS